MGIGREKMISSNRCFSAVAMLTFGVCVLSAPAHDEISPEMLVEDKYSGPSESIGADTNPGIKALYSGTEHVYNEKDFGSSTGDKNSLDVDKNIGDPSVRSKYLQDKSFDTRDAYTDEKTGHYYQGNGRRRVGTGFGHGRSSGARRRSIKPDAHANPGDVPPAIAAHPDIPPPPTHEAPMEAPPADDSQGAPPGA